MIAIAHLLRTLRRFPGCVLHRAAQLLFIRAARLLDGRLEEIKQAICIGSEEIRIALEFLLEGGHEFLVGRGIDVDRIAGRTQKSLSRAVHRADILLRHRASGARKRQLVGEHAIFLELREETHRVVAGRRSHDDVRTCRPDLADVRGEVLCPERRERASDVGAAQTLDIVLKRGNAAAAHLIVGADEEIAFTRHVFRQP